ncbi:MAG: DUF308 domain-containing protein [Firmicutes bacterium]|nr:DUF308 domain-containing protein [Bacillota bacterium]
MKKLRWGYMPLISAGILFIIGILLLIFPAQFLKGINQVLGILLLIIGIEQIIYGIFSKDTILLPNFSLTQGVVSFVLSMLLLFRPNLSNTVIGIIVGIWVVSSATLKLNVVFQKSSLKLPWGWDLLDCFLKFVFGFILIFKPFKGFTLWTMFAGGYLIMIAIDLLITAIYIDKVFRK